MNEKRTVCADPQVIAKLIVLAIVSLLYVLSPIDLMPGIPWDDVAAVLLNMVFAGCMVVK
jgi:uncharacterized membrane protein YkvA (DUF1232 family)